MPRKLVLTLTPAERSLLAAIFGFIEAGEISGGPLDAESPQQRAANLRVFASLCDKISRPANR